MKPDSVYGVVKADGVRRPSNVITAADAGNVGSNNATASAMSRLRMCVHTFELTTGSGETVVAVSHGLTLAPVWRGRPSCLERLDSGSPG